MHFMSSQWICECAFLQYGIEITCLCWYLENLTFYILQQFLIWCISYLTIFKLIHMFIIPVIDAVIFAEISIWYTWKCFYMYISRGKRREVQWKASFVLSSLKHHILIKYVILLLAFGNTNIEGSFYPKRILQF